MKGGDFFSCVAKGRRTVLDLVFFFNVIKAQFIHVLSVFTVHVESPKIAKDLILHRNLVEAAFVDISVILSLLWVNQL